MLDSLLFYIKKLVPKKLFRFFQPIYHFLLAFFAAVFYRFPSRNIQVIAVTGTKGKTSTVEFVNSILEEAGFKTALAGTLRFKIGSTIEKNLYKMTMPGRFFIQKFIRRAVDESCDYLILEVTSQGVLQFRHLFISLDALIFTNLSPEHIESHGSFEKYREAKLKIRDALVRSKKEDKILVVNKDDPSADLFLEKPVEIKKTYSLEDARDIKLSSNGVSFSYENETIHSSLPGEFTVYNILAALTFSKEKGVSLKNIKRGVEKINTIRGRAEKVRLPQENPLSEKQSFDVVVDYAHTTDSLEKIYKAFEPTKKICVLGNTGGGRDKWKREEMAKIADTYCDHVILTNEDPYDEDPLEILRQMEKGLEKGRYEIILERRLAIRKALQRAGEGDVVFITGKGTDPYIMTKNNTKIPWDDARVAREELQFVLGEQNIKTDSKKV